MIQFIEYVVSELKSKRLTKAGALSLLRQFSLAANRKGEAILHPLLHRNTSDLSQQSYTSVFNGMEFFLEDHKVNGQKVLPGAAYLEMARAALEKALPGQAVPAAIELKNVVWAQPISVADRKEVSIALVPGEGKGGPETLDFEIYSLEKDAEGGMAETIHSQGSVRSVARPAPAKLDLEGIRARMTVGRFEGADVYRAYGMTGVDYGPGHRSITAIHKGAGELLTFLRLPASLEDAYGDYQIHPGMMDGALQTPIGFASSLEDLPTRPTLPFALESLLILAACPRDMVVWTRFSPESGPEGRVSKLDLDICDADGNVCVQVRGFASRKPAAETPRPEIPEASVEGIFSAPFWETAETDAGDPPARPEFAGHHVILCCLQRPDPNRIEALLPGSRCVAVNADPQAALAETYGQAAAACFAHVRDILRARPGRVLVQLAVPDGDGSLFAGLSGMLKTAMAENPQVTCQLILCHPGIDPADLAGLLLKERKEPADAVVRYGGVRSVLRLKEVHSLPENPGSAFREGGVYLITGGLGGLGILFAKEILGQTGHAKVILCGRSGLDSGRAEVLRSLPGGDDRKEYRQADIADSAEVRELITSIVAGYRRLDGILHAAGILADGFILKKTDGDFNRVLAPKVKGTFNLDEASKDLDLDFLALFSAGASVAGNPGQADYAAANGFMDQFAPYRNRLAAAGLRKGRTVAINWPLWKEGGMGVDEATQEQLRRTTGMHAMLTENGLRAFHRCLAGSQGQILVVEGEAGKLRSTLLAGQAAQRTSAPPMAAPEPARAASRPSPLSAGEDADGLKERTLELVKKEFSSVLKIPVNRIDANAPLEKYGIDSIMAMNLTSQLEKTFGPLSKTLFFEYQSIDDLIGYLLKNHHASLAALFAVAAQVPVRTEPVAVAPRPASSAPAAHARPATSRMGRRRNFPATAPVQAGIDPDPIAIIGLSGRYPEAADIQAFWANLRMGKDSIVEIPKERWDWREFYTGDRTRNGHHYSKWGGFIEGVDEFDPRFFNISPREARFIEPQERLFLQHAWTAMEDAGLTRAALQIPRQNALAAQVGVYVGVMYSEYQLFGAEALAKGKRMGVPGSYASIANRVSYALNLHGPSLTLDTMCSSSLTAIHIACQDLKLGVTDLAIAGGVNLSLHPNKYLVISAGQFISSDGHCQSFGVGGDGYIPAEGVGAVLLKRLSRARRDGNHVYGIIRGSSINHGGRTNGYSVPNPNAQSNAISLALAESGINARHISYIEAHGTGTKLGDPIEIAGLSQAFRKHTPDTGFCLIGSAKSNIGHCESAAGIAGLTKVLLQMKHRQIVPSLHSTVLNPHIDFSKTPFVVNQKLRAWERPVLEGRTLPRVAGISSFGAGGANAHIIVEEGDWAEAPARPIALDAPQAMAVVPLSARTADQLKQKARELLAFIRAPEGDSLDLTALAYTLQVGREAMEERFGLAAGTLEQLADKLQAYIRGDQDIDLAYQGHVKSQKSPIAALSADADFQGTIDKWIAHKKHANLLEMWVNGLDLDWNRLYPAGKPRLMSLPGYPFAKERYWIELAQEKDAAGKRPAVLHPLLHANTSDLYRVRFASEFDGSESFLTPVPGSADGRDAKALPALACLEMARAAAAQVSHRQGGALALELESVSWGLPIPVVGHKRVQIDLRPVDPEGGPGMPIEFEIYSAEADQETIHCQGIANFKSKPRPGALDMERLKAAGGREMWTMIDLSPSTAGETSVDFLLQPMLLEGVLQAALSLAGSGPSDAHLVPIALDSLLIHSPCAPETLIRARFPQAQDSGAGALRLDMDLCDRSGNISVQIKGLLMQRLQVRTVYETGEGVSAPAALPESAAPIQKPQAVQLGALDAPAEMDFIPGAASKPLSLPQISLQDFEPFIASAPAERASRSASPAISLSAPLADENAPQTAMDASGFNREGAGSNNDCSPEELRFRLANSLAAALYLSPSEIDSDRPFIDLGLDSIVGVEWIKAVNKEFGLEISATRVYDFPTLKEFAAFLKKELEQKIPAAPVEIPPERGLPIRIEAPRAPMVPRPMAPPGEPAYSKETLRQKLGASLATALYLEVSEIDPGKPFIDLGLDSIVGVEWIKAVNKMFGTEISATRVYDYPNLEEFAMFLKKELDALDPVSAVPDSPAPAENAPAMEDMSVAPAFRPAGARFSIPASIAYPTLSRKPRAGRATPARERDANPVPQPLDLKSAEKIAIIGMSGRYPQARNLDQYWENLAQGRNSITEVPPSRWDVNRYYDPDPAKKGKIYCKWLGALDDVDCFDPLFFQITPAEAEFMDPQHRLFMEESYKAFEDAGYSPRSLSNRKCGVYLGIMSNDYFFALSRSKSVSDNITGNSFAIGAARIAYFLNLKGPAIAIDTACSSSLVAIHLACQGLLSGETDMALAGGVSLYLSPESYLGMCQAGMLSPQGQCKTFDDSANGFVPGEGVGTLVLKRLQDAERDNDRIYGVILGSGINQDGKTNGITAPSVNSQIELERDVYSRNGIDPESITYVETHGTGTKLGDPIELEALAAAFKGKSGKRNFCALGSVKTNIGHTSGAAGVASVQKALLSMRHRTLVPTLNVENENSHFDFGDSPFYISREKKAWESAPGSPLRAGVSSFGFSGTNAHLVLEEYRSKAGRMGGYQSGSGNAEFLILLSARTVEQLKDKARDLQEHVSRMEAKEEIGKPDEFLASIAYTLQTGREPMKARLVCRVGSLGQLKSLLRSFAGGENPGEGFWQGLAATEDRAAAALFGSGTDHRKAIAAWFAEGNLAAVADAWVKGLEPDWTSLYGDGRPPRAKLPTYPFARERYWIQAPAESAPEAATKAIAAPAAEPAKIQSPIQAMNRTPTRTENVPVPEVPETLRVMQFQPHWKPSALAEPKKGDLGSGPILVLDTRDAMGPALEKQLANRVGEHFLVRIRQGDSYRELGKNGFSVRTGSQEDFERVLECLESNGRLPGKILLPGLGSDEWENESSTLLEHGVYALFHFCNAWMKRKYAIPLQILAAYASRPHRPAPLHAALGGFLKSLSMENPKCFAKVLEFQGGPGSDDGDAAAKAILILEEFREPEWAQKEVLFHFDPGQGRYSRFTREFIPLAPVQAGKNAPPIKQKGVYLLSGGLGGLGFHFSEYLAARYQANLVLFGRSAPNAEQAQKLERLRAFNPDILYLQANVAELRDMEAVVQAAKARFSRVDGVIHSAGIIRDAFLIRKTQEEMDQVLKPKIQGALNLDRATRGEELDLFILFSSIAGALGNAGQTDYAYGNRFLDAFAESRENLRKAGKRSGKSMSINWPFWQEGGMSLPQAEIELVRNRSGISPLPTQAGLDCFEEFLRADAPQALAVYGSPSRIGAYLAKSPSRPAHADIAAAPAQEASPAYLSGKTETYLKELIGREIKLAPERIGSGERMESFGIDSIVINKMNVSLEKDLGPLSKTLFYEYETVEDLAKYLVANAARALSGLFKASEPAPAAATHEEEPSPAAGPSSAEPSLAMGTTAAGPASAYIHLPAESRAAPEEPERIAIIGMHGRFPQSGDLDAYWENLRKGKDLIDLVPSDRWNPEEFYHPDPAKASEGRIYCKWGGFLDHVDKFDPAFFSLSREDAKNMDPQERIFLESVWASFEDAGYTRERLRELHPKGKSANVGVFVGVTTNSYHLLGPEERSRGNQVNPGSLPWSIANRVSYFFNFQGPSMPIDTACSSSLVAIHLACESLKRGECKVAVAGGVNLYLHPSKYQSFCVSRMVSVGGKCRSYGAGDDGFVPGEGVGSLILKPLKQAIEDRDRILGVVAGSAYEHSGRSNGYSAPNPNSQAILFEQALAKAGIHPETISYVEGHGTGTQLGDSLEVSALTNAFRKHTDKKRFCSLGSVKSNIGHSESAAGMAGVAKILLQIKHKHLAPSLNSREANPNIDFEGSPFFLQHELAPWIASARHPRRALVNSFGAGGVNACVLLEEYERPAVRGKSKDKGPFLFPVSAKDEARLHDCVDRLLMHIGKEKKPDLAGLAYTLQVGREAMPARFAIVASERKELLDLLRDCRSRNLSGTVHAGVPGSHELRQLAEAWVSGKEIAWETLHTRGKPARVSLPAYPFARERYWVVDETPAKRKGSEGKAIGRLHPLVSCNTSNLRETGFHSVLSESAFCARDHKVAGESVFPGAGFVEIACICGNIAGENKVWKIQDIVWIQPLAFPQGGQSVQTSLKSFGSAAEYAIYSLNGENEKTIHSEGRLVFRKGARPHHDSGCLPLRALRDGAAKRMDGSACYALFREAGFEYGPSFQTIQELHISGSYALAKLRIADSLKADFGEYILHPSLIDGALQAVVGLVWNPEDPVPHLPFAIEELEILRPLQHTCHVLVESADPETSGGGDIRKFNIRIADETGGILVTIKNFCVRALHAGQPVSRGDGGNRAFSAA